MTTPRTLLLGLFLSACASKSTPTDSGTDSGSTGSEGSDPDDAVELEPVEVSAEALFDVTGGPYDLAIHPDGRVFCSIRESRLEVWDPAIGWTEEVSDDLGPIFGIALDGDDVYFTTSNHRQSGSLARLVQGEVEVLATAAGSTIFREPTDLAQAPDGSWVLADKTLQTLIGVESSGEAWLVASPSELSTLAFMGSTLYFGGEDGTWRMDWPDGEPEPVDNRSVNGLHAWQGSMWGTNIDSRVYEIAGTQSISVDDVRVPGRLAGEEVLLLADWGLADVWAIER
jgi:hypothetical protein